MSIHSSDLPNEQAARLIGEINSLRNTVEEQEQIIKALEQQQVKGERKYYFKLGQNDAKFPFCACEIDEQDEDNFKPCALHEHWLNEKTKKLQQQVKERGENCKKLKDLAERFSVLAIKWVDAGHHDWPEIKYKLKALSDFNEDGVAK